MYHLGILGKLKFQYGAKVGNVTTYFLIALRSWGKPDLIQRAVGN